MYNPYYEAVKEFIPGPGSDWLFKPQVGNWLKGYEAREKLVGEYSWAIPNEEAIKALVAASPVVEIGAGTGYWANLIRSEGGTIFPYDNYSWDKASKTKAQQYDGSIVKELTLTYAKTHQWCTVKRGGPEKVNKHPDCTLFLCWPPYLDPMAVDSLLKYKGDTLIYVGEQHGCTASPLFQEFLEADWELEKTIDIPHYYGIHDAMFIYKRL